MLGQLQDQSLDEVDLEVGDVGEEGIEGARVKAQRYAASAGTSDQEENIEAVGRAEDGVAEAEATGIELIATLRRRSPMLEKTW